ncbi:ClpXP protease specificity-enhancing factor [Shewanella sp. Choline-02u-19]|jgi:stringent starvation protein B|uniref:ClpXP protease specificity-enhancing factor n=1 Tax=unclassified Shewanella TaxID=196818 RepID=UPI000C31F25A|nr:MULTISPECIES: ClpXP protease specificity-enhancing factor [unclassified Shewanella]PKG55618.1 ClpXP protease specificity-enhancing factor [Shewanella sp. GutDb-MelDb]PKG76524.1 ClpXP protease specificity-enhancing factor [Shewanella sp. GutCb]PKH55428.1 ClpXP protease specificity-enhancing factor [Shewanella sp. Bg11-22]PKI28775.1 ClpXP protease specificity-enhancing factor [Shewanella sp. Choline-02u-19]
MKELTPNRPYLLRAYYDWLMDNQLTPHVVVDAYVPGTQVPQQYVKDGQIVLNITESAVGNLQITNEFIEFSARFGGVPQQVLLPMAAIVAIYARENGAGTVFDLEESYQIDDAEETGLSVVKEPVVEISEPEEAKEEVKEPKRRGHLTLVK